MSSKRTFQGVAVVKVIPDQAEEAKTSSPENEDLATDATPLNDKVDEKANTSDAAGFGRPQPESKNVLLIALLVCYMVS